jgi:acetoin utilization deacetylase AcuC-like enzyme
MNNVGFIYHPDYLKHETGLGHPERPQRLESVVHHLLALPLWKELVHLQPSPAPVEWVSTVHPERYVEMIRRRCSAGEVVLDGGDTHVCRESYDVALAAAGAVLQAIDQVVQGTLGRRFAPSDRPDITPRRKR